MAVVVVAFAAASRDMAVARIGWRAGRRVGLARRCRLGRVLVAAAGPAMRAVSSRNLVAGHGSPILLIPLIGRVDLDVPLAALLVDIAVALVRDIAGKVRWAV